MSTGGRLLLTGLALAATAGAAQAQTYRYDFGLNGGYSTFTASLGADETGGSTMKFSAGWMAGAQATFWFTPRVGLRANMTYADRAIESDGGLVAVGGDPRTLDHMNVWNGTGDVLLRLRRPATEFQAGEWLPYIVGGAGVRWINPAGDPYATFDFPNMEFWTGVPFRIEDGGADRYFVSELSDLMFLAAVGTDVRLTPGLGLRLEFGDRMSTPYIYEVEPATTPGAYLAVDGRNNIASFTHELYAQLGLHLTLGGATRAAPVMAVTPPPATPAPAPAPPRPAPAPTEEQITVCVIDPGQPGGVRDVAAVRMIASGDTLVVRRAGGGDATHVAFSSVLPDVRLIGAEEWYVAGRPLVVPMSPVDAQYLATGQPIRAGSGELILLGAIDGLPVYARPDQVAPVAARLSEINASGPVDLAATLRDDEAVRAAFAEVRTLHVPARTAGCMFQPLVLQEQVRKTGN